jgi:hypothetical protein
VPTNLIEFASDRNAPAGETRPLVTHPGARRIANRDRGLVQALLIIAAAVLICLVATSGRSLWIDEACTAVRAMQPTLTAWWQAMAQEKTGCLQMPLYMLYTWGWAKLFGLSEWSLHLANLPWFVTGAAAFVLAFPAGNRRRPIAACVVLLSPFAWYYLDEARPYAMQLGAGLLVVASLRRLAEGFSSGAAPKASQVMMYLLGIATLCGSSLFGMIWAAAAIAALVMVLSRAQLTALLKRHCWLWLAGAGSLLLFAVYYAWTLRVGARGSGAATTTWGSIFFVGYELLGFAGLGPGRLEMRSTGLTALQGHWTALTLYAITTGILIGAAVLQGLKCGNRKHFAIILVCALPAILMLGAGCAVHFRVLGRHLAPLAAVLLLVLAFGASGLWSRGTGWARLAAGLFCVLSLLSCLSLRFSARHEKDNYRAAAAMAKTALGNGQTVWWNAAEEGARYYGVPVATRAASGGQALFVMDPTRESLGTLPMPQIIIASKPDLYDGQMAVAEYIRDRGFSPVERFTAFVVYERKRN